jgi:chemotaxis protein CheX
MIARDDAVALVEHIWGLVLGLPARVTTSPPPEAGLAMHVPVRGAWAGYVVLHCDPALARLAAGRMFGVAPEGVTDEQTHDALGELTNILGGNLKRLLPGSSSLGLPSAVSPGFPATAEPCLVRATFECEGLPFEAALFGCQAPLAAGR